MRTNFIRLLTAVSGLLLFTPSCKKETASQPDEQNIEVSPLAKKVQAKPNKRVRISNVTELYAAINDPANTSVQIELSPGIYSLSANFPNSGRLELLENMSLIGTSGHKEEVIIDASSLPGTSFVPPNNFPAARTGAIRMGRGYNALEWLTVKGNASAQSLSAIDTDLIWEGISQVRIAHVKVSGARIGIDIRNTGAASVGRIIEAELEENEIVENLVQQGQGIEIQNANGASGGVIRANLRSNHVHGNKVGLRSFTNNANGTTTNNGSISIQSHADRFTENGIGIFLVSGLSQTSPTTANNNTLAFEAHATAIEDNRGTLPPGEQTPACGMYAVAGVSVPGGSASGNKLSVKLWGCRFSNNEGADMIAYGAVSNSALQAGTYNRADISLQGVSKKAIVIATPSIPVEPAGTNVIRIVQ